MSNSTTRQRMLTNFRFIYVFIFLAISVFVCQVSVHATEENVADDVPNYKYVKPEIDTKLIEQEADEFFYQGIKNEDKTTKEAYLIKSLEKYMLLLDYDMYDAVSATQVAVIHDKLGNDDTALEYFKRAVNLENLNPFANFYFAEYYFYRRDYRNALKYYLTAYENGFDNSYQTSIKLATIYEKFGDFQKAKKFYILAQKQNPELRAGVVEKLKSLKKVYYNKSAYK